MTTTSDQTLQFLNGFDESVLMDGEGVLFGMALGYLMAGAPAPISEDGLVPEELSKLHEKMTTALTTLSEVDTNLVQLERRIQVLNDWVLEKMGSDTGQDSSFEEISTSLMGLSGEVLQYRLKVAEVVEK